MGLEVTLRWLDSAVVAAPRGDIDTATERQLREPLLACLETAPHVLVVDLAKASFLDSSALGVLVAAARHAERIGCTFCLASPPAKIARLLATTGLDKAWPVYPNVAAALGAHGRETSQPNP